MSPTRACLCSHRQRFRKSWVRSRHCRLGRGLVRARRGTVSSVVSRSGERLVADGSLLNDAVVLYLSAPLLGPPSTNTSADSLLTPYLTSLLSHSSPTPLTPLFTATYFLSSHLATNPPPNTPANFLVVPRLPSEGSTAALATSLDEAVEEAERVFWKVVGEEGRAEGVGFFVGEARGEEEEE